MTATMNVTPSAKGILEAFVVFQCMTEGDDVIADACHLHRGQRKKTMYLARMYGYTKVAVEFHQQHESKGYGPLTMHPLEDTEGFDRFLTSGVDLTTLGDSDAPHDTI